MTAKVVREFIIHVDADGQLSLWEGNRTTGQLSLGEVLESVASLCHPMLQKCPYPMYTEKEWEERWHPNRSPNS